MITRAQARAQEAHQAQITKRRALYAHNAGTGNMPPEFGYAPVKPIRRVRLFA